MRDERPLVDQELVLDTALKNVRRQNYFIMQEIEQNNLPEMIPALKMCRVK